MEYCTTMKMNAFESVLMKQMNLEPIIQNEVSQNEKDKYHILMHIYGIQKDSTDDSTFRRQQRRHRHKEQILDTVGEGEDAMI